MNDSKLYQLTRYSKSGHKIYLGILETHLPRPDVQNYIGQFRREYQGEVTPQNFIGYLHEKGYRNVRFVEPMETVFA